LGGGPLLGRRRGKRKPPLEARNNFEPWLPLQDAYPEVPATLQVFAVLLLSLIVFAALFLLFAQLAS